MTTEQLDVLLEKFHKGQCTREELLYVNELLEAYASGNENLLNNEEQLELLNEIRNKVESNLRIPIQKKGVEAVPLSVWIVAHKWWLGAAVVFICLGIFYWPHPVYKNKLAVHSGVLSKITPGSVSASLVLPNGQVFPLDSSVAKTIKSIQISKSGLFINKLNGQRINLDRTAALLINSMLITKRGQQAPPMTLSDGTKVWLNAASTLRFPLAFNGTDREVELSGEAYFEVAKDAAHPFVVKTVAGEIKVLGTHFNVKAYNDEPAIYATLLEGAIQIRHKDQVALLSPGEQGYMNQEGTVGVRKANLDAAVAWMNGKLPLENMDVHAFLREVSRWYDVDIQYESEIPAQTFSGNLSRKVPLEYILAALQANGVKCRLKDRKLIISK